MGKVVLAPDGTVKLESGQSGAEVYDAAGNVVGYYLPHDEYVQLQYATAPRMTPQQLEEARRDFRENGGVTTQEVLDHLRRLDERLRGGR